MQHNLSHRLKNILEIAKKVSKNSKFRYKVGAVIFNGGKIIAIGNNSTKTNPKLSRIFRHATLHAECDAILHCTNPHKLKGSNIFIVRETKDGNPAMARPCDMCITMMYEHKIKIAYWTIPVFPYWDSENVEDLHSNIDIKQLYTNNGKIFSKKHQ